MFEVSQSSLVCVQTKKINVRSIQRQEDIPECRICLGFSQQGNELISACNCTGSVKYIHTKCFKIWIGKRYNDHNLHQQIISPQGLICQICHQRYMYTYEMTEEWCSCSTFRKKLSNRKYIAIGNLFFIIIDLLLLSIMLTYAINDPKDPQFNINMPRFFIVYIALFFAVCSALYGLSEFKKTFLIHKSFQISLMNKIEQSRIKVIKGCQNNYAGPDEIQQRSHMRITNNPNNSNPRHQQYAL